MPTLGDDNKRAKAMGFASYGQYKAHLYLYGVEEPTAPIPQRSEKVRKRRYTDMQAFELWKTGKSDSEIGKALGVSRQIIQRWRDTMELPSTATHEVDTSRYHLIETESGIFVVNDAT